MYNSAVIKNTIYWNEKAPRISTQYKDLPYGTKDLFGDMGKDFEIRNLNIFSTMFNWIFDEYIMWMKQRMLCVAVYAALHLFSEKLHTWWLSRKKIALHTPSLFISSQDKGVSVLISIPNSSTELLWASTLIQMGVWIRWLPKALPILKFYGPKIFVYSHGISLPFFKEVTKIYCLLTNSSWLWHEDSNGSAKPQVLGDRA